MTDIHLYYTTSVQICQSRQNKHHRDSSLHAATKNTDITKAERRQVYPLPCGGEKYTKTDFCVSAREVCQSRIAQHSQPHASSASAECRNKYVIYHNYAALSYLFDAISYLCFVARPPLIWRCSLFSSSKLLTSR